jgi:hypothetical protein
MFVGHAARLQAIQAAGAHEVVSLAGNAYGIGIPDCTPWY